MLASSAVLYSCSQRVALHVHTSRLLRRRPTEIAPHDVSIAAFESDQRSVVEGMKDMQVDDHQGSSSQQASALRPATCSEAVALGLQSFETSEFEKAIDFFTLALELPGNGAMRMAGTVKEYACPSEGEEQAALYNMACCYAKLDEVDSGLTCLSGLLESGFSDFDTIRTDPDLAGLRGGPDFESLINQFDNLANRLISRRRKAPAKKGWLSRW